MFSVFSVIFLFNPNALSGNYVVDIAFTSPVSDVHALASQVSSVVGVVEHGLFLDMASVVLIAEADGTLTTMA